MRFARHSSNVSLFFFFLEEFVRSNLIASPLMKRLFTPGGWHEVKCVSVERFQPVGVLPYMGYIGMCRREGYGFQAVYSRIGYINQGVWV